MGFGWLKPANVPCGILKVTEAETMNDEELIRRFESIEKKVDVTASLVRVGFPTLTGLDTKVNGLIDSQVVHAARRHNE